jgi:ABC-type multidrug transport system fused ATPase/permease subunit
MQPLELFRLFRRPILLALSIVLIEKLAWILEPTVFGNVIDAMIASVGGREFAGVIVPLAVWIGVFVLNSGAGTLRRSLDERIYLRIFTELTTRIAELGKSRNLPSTTTAARAELSREYITFFQYRIPETIEQFVDIAGAIVALAFFDWRISLTCLVIVIPMAMLTRMYTRRVSILQKELHDSREEIYETFAARDPEQVRGYYKKMATIQQRIANWGALNFGIFRVFLLGIFLVVLYISIDIDDFTTGSIYSIVAYLWTFVTSAEYLPDLMESWTSLREISERLRTEESVEE